MPIVSAGSINIAALQVPGLYIQIVPAELMRPTRADIRRERAETRQRIDPACPAEIDVEVRTRLAAALAGRRFERPRGDTLGDLVRRECPDLFTKVEAVGFVCPSICLKTRRRRYNVG
jgi:hypothetical protein